MDTYLLDWLGLLLRWAHVVVAAAWIGASFQFVAVDNSLMPPESEDDRKRGVGGERWAVHGGGFYHQQKYPASPPRLPEKLHWSMWESYSTWLTGFALFTVTYLFQAGSFLIDKSRFDWSTPAAIATALGFLAVFWLVYDAICRMFGRRLNGDAIVGALIFALVVFACWLSCQLFAGRAAFLLVGAMLATVMSANVLMWIIPGQRKVVAALRAGEAVDPVHGQRGKQRSVHNTYFTLPVLLAMISNHYGFLYRGEWNWLTLAALMLGGALIRQSFVARHKALVQGKPVPWTYAIAGVALIALVVGAMARLEAATSSSTPSSGGFGEVQRVVEQRCLSCHSGTQAFKGVRLDSEAAIRSQAQAMLQQAVLFKTMPLNNATKMTDAERETIRRWVESGAL